MNTQEIECNTELRLKKRIDNEKAIKQLILSDLELSFCFKRDRGCIHIFQKISEYNSMKRYLEDF